MTPNYHDDDDGIGDRARAATRPLILGAFAVVALCVAFLTGHSMHSPPADPTTDAAASTAPSAPAPTSTSPARSNAPRAAAPGGPLTRNSAGVIIGYRHDQAGAVAAAGNYTAALYVHTNRTHARELAVLSAIAATPADATRMAGDFASEDAALARLLDVTSLQSPGVIAYGHPLGYRVESVTSTAAVIDVYVAGGQGVADAPSDSAGAGQTFYEVDQVQLAWQSPGGGAATGGTGDWRMRNWSHLVQDNGPALASIAAEGYLPFPIGQTDPDTTGGRS